MSLNDLTGKIFEYLTVLSYAGRTGSENRASWNCVCKCGTHKVVLDKRLKSGATKSCGCKQLEAITKTATKHGLSADNRREYRAWLHMRERCTNPNVDRWESYGGRGINVCDRWNSFEYFLADMGKCPSGLTLERLDVDGNYEPNNCCWATWEDQRLNKRKITHCKRGHEFTEENTYRDSFGRHCKTCRREMARKEVI